VKCTRFPGGSGSQQETISKYIFAPQKNTKSIVTSGQTIYPQPTYTKRRLGLRFCPQQSLNVRGIYLNISKHNLIK
jgi:hypothetical protein